jgi:hypothetical protein
MQNVYSWMGSRLHLVLEDEVADAYNRAQDAFMEAQRNYKATTGKDWTGAEPMWMNWTDQEQTAWNSIAGIINNLVKLNGGALDIKEDELTSEYLVKI